MGKYLNYFDTKCGAEYVLSRILILVLLCLPLGIQSANAQLVRISGMDDFAFGSWSGSGNLTSSSTVCIYRSSGGGNYSVTASGSGAGSSFTVASGGSTIAYQVRWKQVGNSFSTLTASSPSSFAGASSSLTCGGSDNAEMEVQFSAANLGAASAGSYSGTLTFIIAPN